MARLLALLLLSSCASAPAGMKYANPNCVIRCGITVAAVENAPQLQTLNTTQHATGGAVTKSKTTTETDTSN